MVVIWDLEIETGHPGERDPQPTLKLELLYPLVPPSLVMG